MAINARGLPIQLNFTDIQATLLDILKRAVDGTVVPVFVDYTNQRVIIGATVSAGSGAKLQVNGDIEIIGSSNGFIVSDENGSGKSARIKGYRDSTTGLWTLDVVEV